MMLAPFKTQTIWLIKEGIRRSDSVKLNNFPINDFLETEMQIGFEIFDMLFRPDMMLRSRSYQLW